jgi:hypothetical protein
MSLLHPGTGERVCLAVRTSMLNEYRNDAGQLRAFEIRRELTGFGTLCSSLAKISGVKFQALPASSWYPRPARFVFQGHAFQVAIPFADYWIGPTEHGDSHASLKEILDYVKLNMLRHRLVLARSHYVSDAPT